MITSAKRDGNKLTLTIELAATPYQSKSAVAKALKAGLTAADVPAEMLASSGGFASAGDGIKISFNVMKR